MTVVGKLLVFLNLVFSLVVGGLAVVDYTARTHWKEGFDKVKAQNDVLRAFGESQKREADQLAKERTQLSEKLNAAGVTIDPAAKDGLGDRAAELALAELRVRANTISELSKENDNLRKQLGDERAKAKSYTAMEAANKTQAEIRQADTKLLRDTLKTEMDKSFKMQQEMNLLRDDMVNAQIAAKTYKDRNGQLETQLQDLARDLARAKSNLGAASSGIARGANPPPDNVEGLVRRADGNLVTISLGTDAGIAKGQTMEVFRLGTNPKYIGRIRIVEVTPTQAVGQHAGRMTVPVQVGDRVGSKVMGGY